MAGVHIEQVETSRYMLRGTRVVNMWQEETPEGVLRWMVQEEHTRQPEQWKILALALASAYHKAGGT